MAPWLGGHAHGEDHQVPQDTIGTSPSTIPQPGSTFFQPSSQATHTRLDGSKVLAITSNSCNISLDGVAKKPQVSLENRISEGNAWKIIFKLSGTKRRDPLQWKEDTVFTAGKFLAAAGSNNFPRRLTICTQLLDSPSNNVHSESHEQV